MKTQHTPEWPDLAKLWRRDGGNSSVWDGSLGVLAQHEVLNEALEKALLKIEIHEQMRLRQSVMDWASKIYVAMDDPTRPLLDPQLKDKLIANPEGQEPTQYKADLCLFGIPLIAEKKVIDYALKSNSWTKILRQKGVFDSTSMVVMMGSMAGEHALCLSPQLLSVTCRTLRKDLVEYWHHQRQDMSSVSKHFLQELFKGQSTQSEHLPRLTNADSTLQCVILVGARLAMCQKDGHAHDVLTGRRNKKEDEQFLDLWHEEAISQLLNKTEHSVLLGEPQVLGRVGEEFLNLMIEGQMLMYAFQHQSEEVIRYHISEQAEQDIWAIRGETNDGYILPIQTFSRSVIQAYQHLLNQKKWNVKYHNWNDFEQMAKTP